jgi:Nif11 domain
MGWSCAGLGCLHLTESLPKRLANVIAAIGPCEFRYFATSRFNITWLSCHLTFKMASDQFYLFTALAAFNTAVQTKLRQVVSPEDIIAIAAEHGFAITLQQLSFFSSRLSADHWIWANKGDAWREDFFSGEQQLDLLTA